jgi:hypothetical protein
MKLTYEETPDALQMAQPAESAQEPDLAGGDRLLERFQIPRPRIVEKKVRMPCQQELSFCQRIWGTSCFPEAEASAAHARAS